MPIADHAAFVQPAQLYDLCAKACKICSNIYIISTAPCFTKEGRKISLRLKEDYAGFGTPSRLEIHGIV